MSTIGSISSSSVQAPLPADAAPSAAQADAQVQQTAAAQPAAQKAGHHGHHHGGKPPATTTSAVDILA